MTIDDKIRYMIYSYAKKRAKGFSRVDYRDIAQEACCRVLARSKPVEKCFIPIFLKRIVGNVWLERYTHKTTHRKEMLDEACKLSTLNAPPKKHAEFSNIDIMDCALNTFGGLDEQEKVSFFDSVRYNLGLAPKCDSQATFYRRRNILRNVFNTALMHEGI